MKESYNNRFSLFVAVQQLSHFYIALSLLSLELYVRNRSRELERICIPGTCVIRSNGSFSKRISILV